MHCGTHKNINNINKVRHKGNKILWRTVKALFGLIVNHGYDELDEIMYISCGIKGKHRKRIHCAS